MAVLLVVATLSAAPNVLAADEARFDAQVFRPLAAPRDLVMVPKTEVIGHLSPVLGVYWDAALNPLALALGDSNKTLNAVGARLQMTPLFGLGLLDWVELTMAVDFEMDRAILKDASRPVLEAVRRVLRERPDILLVEIQGHTDARGSAAYGLRLTGLQAKSVRQYLIAALLPKAQKQSLADSSVLPFCNPGAASNGCVLPRKEGVLKKDTVLEKPNTMHGKRVGLRPKKLSTALQATAPRLA